ncbi:hypothetical protein ACFL17_04300 [Pseudomonadota bacterium]
MPSKGEAANARHQQRPGVPSRRRHLVHGPFNKGVPTGANDDTIEPPVK